LIEVQTNDIYDENNNSNYASKSILSPVCIKKIVIPTDEMFSKGINEFE